MESNKIRFKDSKLRRDGTAKERDKWKEKISQYLRDLSGEQAERKKINDIRRDFLLGNQSSYTNIIGLEKKEKKGHANATFNYAGKTCVKLYYGLANKPPAIKIPGLPVAEKNMKSESLRAQGVEDFQNTVFHLNKFWFNSYPRAVMNQITTGAGAVKVYYDTIEKTIKIIQKENTNNLLVGWSGEDAASYTFVIDRERRTVESVEEEFGIKILKAGMTGDVLEKSTTAGSHEEGGEYGTREKTSTQAQALPTGKTDLPKVWVTDYWDDKRNIILINDEIVQYVKHEFGFNPWIIIPNIYIPTRPWGLSDIDFLIDPQIEYNETSNDTRDFIRAATNIKFVAKNMPDFDPEEVKTGSGQVIFIEGDESDFYSLAQAVNTFPADTYLLRIKKTIHDLGVPEVTYGGGTSDSGRAKAIDYQSMADVISDKRRAWNLAFQEISDRIQSLGQKYYPAKFWNNPDTGAFEERPIEVGWEEIIPLTDSERITNIINKFQSGLISLSSALSEAGYKDVDREIEKLKQEESDPRLAPLRHRVVALIPGVREAQKEAMEEQAQTQITQPPEQGGPTLTPEQNQGNTQPMAVPGSNTSFSSPEGFIKRVRQNLNE